MKVFCAMTFDDLERRCPRLGSAVRFGYCRSCEEDRRPCFKVLDCWWEQFDVAAYFRQSLSQEVFERLACPPAPNKVASLVELIQKARERCKV
ncbi:MAG: hypothetical protein WAU91_01465 [Desulfatitalea sp.]